MNYITLTNNGYKKITHNLLKSMEKIGMTNQLIIYCVDNESSQYFKLHYPENKIINLEIDDIKLHQFVPYRSSQHPDLEGKKLWSNITFLKILIMIKELENNQDFIFVDGDIVFLKNPNSYLQNLINQNDLDLIIQNDELDNNDLTKWCSGFLWMKSSIKNLNVLKTANLDNFTNDQRFLRENKQQFKFKVLPLELFPNGKFFRNFLPTDNYLIHFNHDTEQNKINRMIKYNFWFNLS